jgi:hypothetical protein
MSDPTPAMARIVREDGQPAVLLITAQGRQPERFSLTLTALTMLAEDATAATGEAVRRAVSKAGN